MHRENLILAVSQDMLQMGEDTWVWTRSIHEEGEPPEVVSEGNGTYAIYCDVPHHCDSYWLRTSGSVPSTWRAEVVYNTEAGLYRIDGLLYRVQ